jgi:hypothetical protein
MFRSLIALFTTRQSCNNFSEECGRVPEAGVYSGKRALLFEGVAYNCGVACDFERELVRRYGEGKLLGLGVARCRRMPMG